MSNILTNNINPRSGNLITIGGANDRVSIAGTLSYEDVTNIDSVGIITARQGLDTPTDLVLRTGGTERLRITSAGKIQVTGTRAGSLQASDNDSLELYTLSASDSADRGSGITFYNHDGSGYEMGGTIQVAKENGTADNTSSYMRFATRVNGSDVTEKVRITGIGSMGIGTNDPFGELHVEAATQCSIICKTTSSNMGKFSSKGNDVYVAGTAGATNIIFKRNVVSNEHPADSGTETMRIDSNGKLVVGADSFISGANSFAQAMISGNVGGLIINSLDTSASSYCRLIFSPNGNIVGNEGLIRYNTNDFHMAFYTQGGERMRLDGSGNLLVGTSTLFGSGGITLTNAGAIVAPQTYGQVVSSSPRDVFVDSVGLFGYVSSIRESKVNIQPQSNVDWIYQLEPVTFNYKSKNFGSEEYSGVEPNVEYGLIAEDVEPICPELCFYDDTEAGLKLSGIHYRKLITPMLKALQDAKSKIETLEQRLTDGGL